MTDDLETRLRDLPSPATLRLPDPAELAAHGRRRRHRRRAAAAVAAALVVAGAVPLAAALRDDPVERLAPAQGTGGGPTVRWGVRYADVAAYEAQGDAVKRCLRAPGVGERSQDDSLPPGHSALLTGGPANAAFDRCLQLPGVVATAHLPSGAQVRDAAVVESAPWRLARPLGEEDTALSLFPSTTCGATYLGADVQYARDAVIVLLRVAPPPGGAGCPAGPVPDPELVPLPVPLGDRALRDRVPVEPRLCLPGPAGADAAVAEPYLGLLLPQAQRLAASRGEELRVVGTDGQCAGVTADLRPDRVDVDLEQGRVAAVTTG